MTVFMVARRLEHLETLLSLRLVNRTSIGATLPAEGWEITRLEDSIIRGAATIDRAAALLQSGTSAVFVTANEPSYLSF